jgi:parallel beta-helix repeat protein
MNRRDVIKGSVEGLILLAMGRISLAAENANNKIATSNNLNSLGSLLGIKLVKDFMAVGDGVADDTKYIQSALNSGAQTIICKPLDNYSISTVSIPDGVTLDLNGATITARSTISMITTGNNCVIKNGTIDCANTQGIKSVNADGSPYGIYMLGKSKLTVLNVTFTRFRVGVLATTKLNTVYCTGLYVSGCTFNGYVYPSTIPDSMQVGLMVGSTVSANNTIIGTFSSNWTEALLTNAIRITGNKFYGGQYGMALHRCSDVVVSGNDIEEASRGISIQVQSRDLYIAGNTVVNCHTSGIHMSSGVRNCTVKGNVITGTMANDNAAIQAYYGCQDIIIANNTLDSRFDQWDGGTKGDQRSPLYGIRTGQMARNIKISNNFIRGYLRSIAVFTTIYEHIPPSDPNYQNTGANSIEITGNTIVFDYEELVATTYRAQFLQSNSYGIFIFKVGAWESAASGGLGLKDILVEQNKIYDTNYPIVWQYAADTSGSPVVKQNLNSRMNRASSNVGSNAEIYAGKFERADVSSSRNSWVDSKNN